MTTYLIQGSYEELLSFLYSIFRVSNVLEDRGCIGPCGEEGVREEGKEG